MAEGGGSVWGKVVDRSGNAVPDAVIHWVDPRPGDGPVLPRLRFFPFATTDSSGSFWASDLPPGPCVLVADREGLCVTPDGGRWQHGAKLTLPVPREPEVVLQFPHVPMDFSRLRGTLLLPDSRPAREFSVALFSPDRPQPVRSARTNLEGEFEMVRVPPGDYTMIINGSAEVQDCNSKITLHGGKTGTFRATLPPRSKGRSHSARAVCQDESGIPLPGVLVMFSGVNLNAVPVRSGEDGVAAVEGLPVPAFTAMGNLEGYFPGLGQFTQEAGEVPETLITMRRMLTIEVAVFDAATGEALPRYNVHVHTEVAMAGDECGTTPRGIRGKNVMNRGKLVAVPGPCQVMVEAPGYEGKELEVEVLQEGLSGPVKVRLKTR